MDKLPKEVVLLISERLTKRERRECASVCSWWCNFFRNNGLFEKVSFNADSVPNVSSAEAHLPMLNFFEKHNYGRLTTELDIRVGAIEIELRDFIRLPSIFPNVRKLKWEGQIAFNWGEVKSKKSFQDAVQRWRHLQDINEYDLRHVITEALLVEKHSAEGIRNITMVYTDELEDVFGGDDEAQNYFPLPLGLAPNVQSFTAVNPPYTYSQLSHEVDIINTWPSIKLDNLIYCYADNDEKAEEYINEMRSEMNEESGPLHAPAKDVRHLDVTFDPGYIDNSGIENWIRYFDETYTNLVSISLKYSNSNHCKQPFGYRADPYFMATLPTLKKYCLEFGIIDSDVLDIMAEHKVELEDVTVFINKNSTDQFTYLKNSTQKNSLIKLTVHENGKYVDSQNNYGRKMFQLLEQMPQLKELEIDTFRGSILQHNPSIIVTILNSAPHITSLKAPDLISRPSNENITVMHPSSLVNLEIAYCQFELSAFGAQKINQVFENILDSCPRLETFSTQVNVYKAKGDTVKNIALAFSFKEQPNMRKIRIESLYKTYFKFIIKGKVTFYHQEYKDMRRIVPAIDENEVYIQIEANNASIIETSVMSGP